MLVVWLGLAALALHALAGIAHGGFGAMATPAEVGVLEICTPGGMIRIDARTMEPIPTPASQHSDAGTCCDLCGASCGMGVVATTVPVFHLELAASGAAVPPRDLGSFSAHPELTPLVPRGPPIRS